MPGIMPVTQLAQVEKIVRLTGCQFPQNFYQKLKQNENNPIELDKVAEDQAYQQCLELLQRGAPGIHFYTLNQVGMIKRIQKALIAAFKD